jgi:hypothetical protein
VRDAVGLEVLLVIPKLTVLMATVEKPIQSYDLRLDRLSMSRLKVPNPVLKAYKYSVYFSNLLLLA